MKDSRFDGDMKKLLSMIHREKQLLDCSDKGYVIITKYGNVWELWHYYPYHHKFGGPRHKGLWLEEELGEMLKLIYGD